jgi:hypothetical protein
MIDPQSLGENLHRGAQVPSDIYLGEGAEFTAASPTG